MAAYGSGNMQALLKIVYDDGDIRSLQAENFKLLEMLNKFEGPMDPGGKYWLFPLMVKWPSSVGAMAQSGTTRNPQVGVWDNGTVYARQIAATYSLEVAGMQLSKSRKQAFQTTAEAAKEALVLAIRDHKVKKFLGGVAGTLAVCNGAAGPTTTIAVHGQLGYKKGDGTFLAQGAECFHEGLQIVVDPSGTPQYTTVTAVNVAAGTITTSTNVTYTDGMAITYGETGTCMDYNTSWDGLYDLYNAAVAYEGLDPATYPKWAPHVFNGSTAGTAEPLSSKHINRVLVIPRIEAGAEIDVIGAHSVMVQSFMDLFENQIKFEPGEFKGGMAMASWDLMGQKVKFAFDPQFIHNTLLGIPTKDCIRFTLVEGKWMDEDGAVFSRIPNTTQYAATWYSLENIGTRSRNRFAIQRDIEEVF
jgi:hypothetical protein